MFDHWLHYIKNNLKDVANLQQKDIDAQKNTHIEGIPVDLEVRQHFQLIYLV